MSQIDIFGNSSDNKRAQVCSGLNIIENGEFVFYRNFFNTTESNTFFRSLRSNIVWNQESMNMYGRKVLFPRLTAWYGENEKPYTFSGITLHPRNWTSDIIEIKNKIEPITNTKFNSVLLNLYRDGNDSISWHTDAEKELGLNPIIASVNFGDTRSFQLRHINSKQRINLELSHGSLLIMQGQMQHFWQHQVPKTKIKVGERINLTFRTII
jgi:alkylated DNA repair dioxygenase AlkB